VLERRDLHERRVQVQERLLRQLLLVQRYYMRVTTDVDGTNILYYLLVFLLLAILIAALFFGAYLLFKRMVSRRSNRQPKMGGDD